MNTIRKESLITFLNTTARWCVYLLIFSLPFSKSLIEICAVLAAITLVAKKALTGERPLIRAPLRAPIVIFLAASCLSFINTDFFYLSFFRGLISKYAEFVLIYCIVVEVIDTKAKADDLLTMSLLSLGLVTIDGFIQYYVLHVDLLHQPGYPSFKYMPSYDVFPYIGFPTASFPYPNDLAAWLLIYLVPLLSVILFTAGLRKIRLVSIALFIPAFYLFILTKARGAWLGFSAAIIALLVCNIRKALSVVVAVAVIITIAFFVMRTMPSDNQSYHSLLQDIFSMSSVSDRSVMWNNGWKIFMKHPVIGNGLNTFFRHYAAVREDEFRNSKGSYVHNCYLQMAAETGIVGLGAFLFLVGAFIVVSRRRIGHVRNADYANIALGLMAGIIGFLVHSSVDTNLYSLNLATLFWFSMGSVIALSSRELS